MLTGGRSTFSTGLAVPPALSIRPLLCGPNMTDCAQLGPLGHRKHPTWLLLPFLLSISWPSAELTEASVFSLH